MLDRGASGSSPRHVAVIMDGNGRWAERRGLPRGAGHQAGVLSLVEVVAAATDARLSHLTLFAFSTENWRREPEEVETVLEAIRQVARDNAHHWHRSRVRFRWTGRLDRLPAPVAGQLLDLQSLTASNDGMTLTLCVDYGARDELAAAAARLCRDVAAGRLDPEDVCVETLGARLDHPQTPDVDLVIRTSGEQRLSNFLLWQSAYAELWFTDVLWPDFGRHEFGVALAAFGRRDRRFGGAEPAPENAAAASPGSAT
ncbi:MAG: di-trans,poly-cis-decaprenylcistransferase [Catenulispora sp.]|nr:di-trans,poly-cis-decaprenylcistransferase [Catenulispora sp.]